MQAIRSFIFYLFLAVTIVFLTLGVLFTMPFGSVRQRYEWVCRPWARCVLKGLAWICGLKYQNVGMSNMPTDGQPVVVLAKHQSGWDPFWLGSFLVNPPCFIYKKSLHWIPLLGWALWSMKWLPIDRSDGKGAYASFLKRGPTLLKHGWWITLFPESTRVPPGQRVKYKTGGARFACSQGIPILPIAHNAGVFWPKNSISKYAGTIEVRVGPLIQTKGRDPQEVTREVEAWIEAQQAQMPMKHD